MPSDIEYALLSTRVYAASAANRTGVPAGWTEQTWQPDYNLSGFSAGAYRRGGEVVIAYTGTNEGIDWWSNGLAGTGLLPAPQVFEAMRFYLEVKAANPDATSFTFTGHSLGGGLASLMAVFFDKQATVFDEAPFQPTAINPVLLTSLQASLLLTGYTDLDFALYNASFGTLFPLREGNVSHTYLEGEILGTFRTGITTIVGAETPVSMGSSTLGTVDRHAMTLLTAMLGNPAFKSVVQQLPNLATLLLDPTLFGVADRRTPDKIDLLSSLLRRQYGTTGVTTDGRLDRFAADMQQLVGTVGLAQTNASMRDALMIASMEYFHTKATTSATQLFTFDNYGLHFKYSDIGAPSYKSLPMLVEAVNAFLTPEEQALLSGKLVRQDAWHIQSGEGGMIVNGGADNDAMIGGAYSDGLWGGAGNDILISLANNDVLVGEKGNDYLLGGIGFDTYIINPGDGYDTILDTDGQGIINIGGIEAKGSATEGLDPKKWIQVGNVWQDQTNGITYGLVSLPDGSKTLLIRDPNGDTVEVKSWSENALGIKLDAGRALAVTPLPTTTTNLVGDLKPVDSDPAASGTQLSYDSLGNVVVGSEADANRADILFDTSGNDHLQGLGGNDDLLAERGGDDLLEGGAGDDLMLAYAGNDALIGGEGRDILRGYSGDDQLFGAERITDLAAYIQLAENQVGSGQTGDWLSGDSGSDTLVGDVGNDVLLGGVGEDLLIGGAGDDYLQGDASGQAQRDWSLTRTLETHEDGHVTYNPNITGGGLLYGGAGDDVLNGGGGQDIVPGQAGNDKGWRLAA